MKTYKTLITEKELEKIFEQNHSIGGSLNEDFYLQSSVDNFCLEDIFTEEYDYDVDISYGDDNFTFSSIDIIKALDPDGYKGALNMLIENDTGIARIITFDDVELYTTSDCIDYIFNPFEINEGEWICLKNKFRLVGEEE